MDFLCPYHRRQLGKLPAAKQQELWLLWMQDALHHYQRREPQDAILLSGCAFELAGASENLDQGSGLHVELTLSAIFAHQLLRRLGNVGHAEQLLKRAGEILHAAEASALVPLSRRGSVTHCRQVLMDSQLQCDFFLGYLNWPTFWEEPPTASQLAWAYH